MSIELIIVFYEKKLKRLVNCGSENGTARTVWFDSKPGKPNQTVSLAALDGQEIVC
jgi:hypothetical protein